MLSVFIDTILICSTTAFMLLLSGVPIDPNVKDMGYVQAAVLEQVGEFGPLFITVSIFLFAFSSLVATTTILRPTSNSSGIPSVG